MILQSFSLSTFSLASNQITADNVYAAYEEAVLEYSYYINTVLLLYHDYIMLIGDLHMVMLLHGGTNHGV